MCRWYWSICLLVYLSIGLFTAPAASAAITNPALKGELGGAGGGDPAAVFGRFIGSWWGVAYVSGAVIFLLYFAWGAIEMSISGGNKDRVEGAKDKIQNAFIGLALLAGSFALIKAVGFVLGIDILENLSFDLGRIAP